MSIPDLARLPNWLPRVPALAETAARTAGALGLLAYVIGLLTVNSYLITLGVSDFSLLKPRFVYAGILVLVSLAITSAFWALAEAFVGAYLKRVWRDRPRGGEEPQKSAESRDGEATLHYVRRRIERSVRAILWWGQFVAIIAFGLWMAAFTPFAIFGLAMGSGDSWADTRRALALWAGGVILARVTMGAWNEFATSTPRIREWPAAMIFLATYSFVFIFLFGRFIYPAVPEQFGGAKAKPARLVVEPTAVAGLAKVGVPFPRNEPVSACIDILFVADDTYVLRAATGDVLQVGRSVVKAVLLNPSFTRCPSEAPSSASGAVSQHAR